MFWLWLIHLKRPEAWWTLRRAAGAERLFVDYTRVGQLSTSHSYRETVCPYSKDDRITTGRYCLSCRSLLPILTGFKTAWTNEPHWTFRSSHCLPSLSSSLNARQAMALPWQNKHLDHTLFSFCAIMGYEVWMKQIWNRRGQIGEGRSIWQGIPVTVHKMGSLWLSPAAGTKGVCCIEVGGGPKHQRI